MNFITILTALAAISNDGYKKVDLERYYTIPENGRSIFDMIIRNVFLEKDGQIFRTDIGINRYEENINNSNDFYYKSKIEEIGDMSVFYGYEELDGEGFMAEEGKIYPKEIKNQQALLKIDPLSLLQQGYTSVKLAETTAGENFSKYPLNVILKNSKVVDSGIEYNVTPNFILKKGGEVYYAIINGFVYDVINNQNQVKNSLLYKD